MIRTFTWRLTTNCSAIELCFRFVGPVRFELTIPRLKAGYFSQLSYEPEFAIVMTDRLELSTCTVSGYCSHH
jgi:hypothetical protein